MPSIIFRNLTEGDKSAAVERLVSHSSPRPDFFLMIVLSVAMATFGLLMGNESVIIGSMLIAPILYPLLSCALGIAMLDALLIGRSLYTLAKSIVLAVLVSAGITFVFFDKSVTEMQMLIARAEPTMLFVAVAVVAGFAASFALVKPQLSETLPGIAISVAMIPPLAVVGVGFALLDGVVVKNAFSLFGINAVGVIVVGAIVFALMKFVGKQRVAKHAIRKEDKKALREKKRAERG